MPFCQNCGVEHDNSSRFCTNCGVEIKGANTATESASAATSYSNVSSYAGANANPEAAFLTESKMLSKAWNDFKSSPSWVIRCLVLALFSIVPILNFTVCGYIGRWARKAAFRSTDKLDKPYFAEQSFSTGFFIFVFSFVFGFVLGIVQFIFNFIPILGILVSLVLTVFAYPFLQLCLMRISLTRSLASGFEVTKVFAVFKEKFGSVLYLFWIPALILLAVGIALSVIFTLISSVSIFDLMMYVGGDASVLTSVLSYIFVRCGIQIIICFFVFSIASSACNCVVFRAFAYWIAKHAPSWVDEAVRAGEGPESFSA